jgi:hypothetical protein
MVSVLAIGLKVCGFKHGRGEGILRAIKTCSTPSFGGEVKTKIPCRKILRFVKYHLGSMNKILCKAKFIIFFARFSCLLLRDTSGIIARELS